MAGLYPEEIIEEVRMNNDIVDVISEYVQLKKRGKSYFGVCPFHNEKTPSFSVSSDKQIFHCFGCNEGGNVISFLMKVENIGFIEAIQLLAKRAGITLPEENLSDDYKKKKLMKNQLYEVNKEAAKFFFQNLNSTLGAPARTYLEKRGVDVKTIKKFGLGYSLDEWEALINYLKTKGFSQDIIYKAGLSKKSKNSNYIDTFRNRIIFPIFDVSFNIIGFGGRTLGDDLPKYLNTPETLVFNKGKNLYALNFAKKSNSEKIIIVEGYMDVITLYQYGIDFGVASLGTALTEDQAKMLKRYCEEVIVAYDSDTAGQSATLRSIEILNNMNCNLKVMQIPDEKDPDEYIRNYGINKFYKLIESSKTYFQFKIDFIKNQYDIKDVDGKIKFLNTMSSVLAKIDNTIERDAYINVLSEQTGISTESIIAQVNKKLNNDKSKKRISKKQVKETNTVKDDKLDNAEKLLIFLICQEDTYNRFVDSLSLDLFSFDVNKNIASVVFKKLEEGLEINPAELMDLLPDSSDVNAISKIFGMYDKFEDIDKAIKECLEYINKSKKNAKQNEIIKQINNESNDLSKIRELDKLLRSKDK